MTTIKAFVKIRLVLKDLSREGLGHDLEPCQWIFGRVCSKQRALLDLWIGGGHQRPTIGEVAIRRCAADGRLGGGRLYRRGRALGEELPGSCDEGISSTGLLTGSSCTQIWNVHTHYG